MNFKEFIIESGKKPAPYGFILRPRVVCNDGYSFSAQASEGSYSSPREICNEYASVELGFPSKEDDLINQFAECDSDYTKTVYGYVGVDIVEKLIEKHGGINVEKTFKKESLIK